MQVLVADDDPIARRVVARLLDDWGFEPIVVETGADALDTLLARPVPIAILDWSLPDKTGLEVCRSLQSAPRLVYPIIVTGYTSDREMLEALTAGAADFLSKPLKRAHLLARLRTAERLVTLQERVGRAQRFEAVGHLAAGAAHEINTPLQFLGDNLRFLADGCSRLTEFARIAQEEAAAETADCRDLVATAAARLDVEYLGREMPRAFGDSVEGLARVNLIVESMRGFAEAPEQPAETGPIAPVVERVAALVRAGTAHNTEIRVDLAEDLPAVRAYRGQLEIAILGLVQNAAEAVAGSPDPRIHIRAQRERGGVLLAVEDNGPGIAEGIRAKIFDPFFTTKEPGRGLGLGLTRSVSIVRDLHAGTLELAPSDQGSRFELWLPTSDWVREAA